jgi:ABC-type Fe3+-siderophore transport system permease subunit
MLGLLIYISVACIVLWLLYYIIGALVPTPMQQPATVVLVVVGAIFLIWILLQFVGGGESIGLHHALRTP